MDLCGPVCVCVICIDDIIKKKYIQCFFFFFFLNILHMFDSMDALW